MDIDLPIEFSPTLFLSSLSLKIPIFPLENMTTIKTFLGNKFLEFLYTCNIFILPSSYGTIFDMVPAAE